MSWICDVAGEQKDLHIQPELRTNRWSTGFSLLFSSAWQAKACTPATGAQSRLACDKATAGQFVILVRNHVRVA
jgi:hypothetical protein